MMEIIYNFNLLQGPNYISVNEGYEVLTAQYQDYGIQIWIKLKLDKPIKTAKFVVVGT